MKNISDISSINDIEARASELSHKKDYIILYSKETNFYLEVSLNNQVMMIGEDSGIGKTYLLERLKARIKNNAPFNIKNIDEKRISVLLNPDEIGSSPKYADIWFLDRGDMLVIEKVEILNHHLEEGTIVIAFARMFNGVKSEIPAYGGEFTAKIIDGTDCFFIH